MSRTYRCIRPWAVFVAQLRVFWYQLTTMDRVVTYSLERRLKIPVGVFVVTKRSSATDHVFRFCWGIYSNLAWTFPISTHVMMIRAESSGKVFYRCPYMAADALDREVAAMDLLTARFRRL